MHYLTSILKAMKDSSDNYELNGDDEDCEKLSDSEEVQNDGLLSAREIALHQQIQKLCKLEIL
jgi:hypothetical protein